MVYEEDDQRNRRYKMSRAKAPKKSNHKHLNEPCVLEYPVNWFMKKHEQGNKLRSEIGAYCPVCGKTMPIEDLGRWVVSKKVDWHIEQEDTQEAQKELNPLTRTLPTFRVEDPFARSVNIKGANE